MSFGLSKQDMQLILHGPKRTADALNILLFIYKSKDGATCDECSAALDMPHQQCSPRFSELEKTECISPTGIKRKTRSKGLARVCKVSPDANFKKLLIHNKLGSMKSISNNELSIKDVSILNISKEFLSEWKKTKTNNKRSRLIKNLINKLELTEGL